MRLCKRLLSLLLGLVLSLSLLSAADAATGTLVKNAGTRHEVCTALSSQAQAYYTGNYTFEKVSALSGSSTDPMHSEMFTRLSTLMTSTMTNTVSYNSLVDYWPNTDANNGSTNPVLFYSDVTGSNFNREHVWPKSHGNFSESGAGSDLHHLRPTDPTINSTRGNLTMGNVRGVYNSYSTKAYGGKTVLYYTNSVVEVNDNIKGDVARIFLYVWCRWQEPNLYENKTKGNDGLKVIESRETLLQWMELDPVDTWEMSRNDQCENVQGNRNIFIDYPEYAWLIFGLTPPSDYRTPSGNAMSQSPSPTATATAAPTATATATATVKPTATATPVPTAPPAVELPKNGDYVVRINGGYVSEHTETVNGKDCLRVDLFLDGVTSERLLSTITLKLLYDPDQLTYVKYKAPSGNNTTNVANPKVPGYFQYVFASAGGTFLTNTTPVLTLWFTVKEDLPAGTQIPFGFSEEIKATNVKITITEVTDPETGETSQTVSYTNEKRSVGVQLRPFGIAPIYGDANCDCEITAADAALVLRALVGLDMLSETGTENAKTAGQGTYSTEDAALILRYIVGLIERFPAEE